MKVCIDKTGDSEPICIEAGQDESLARYLHEVGVSESGDTPKIRKARIYILKDNIKCLHSPHYY
ncbi:hypothetical protein SAMN02745181_3837 [Rubritalea squalenifaciens DSM 18772]|uniref:Uncharacterized protein n=1 Tax=Rubritalea squalenifaciens DSM 18772 TaxID=1123071 RepID=A0A1M6SIV4_9BACT|nr:hypothetical protein SAMN02745181_3837 [Rubritalea squalenifaciens DSM 18772]